MGDPYKAGQTVTVSQILSMPVRDVDFGEIEITENWGRLFLKHGENQIVVPRHFYRALVSAIAEFIEPVDIKEEQDRWGR